MKQYAKCTIRKVARVGRQKYPKVIQSLIFAISPFYCGKKILTIILSVSQVQNRPKLRHIIDNVSFGLNAYSLFKKN